MAVMSTRDRVSYRDRVRFAVRSYVTMRPHLEAEAEPRDRRDPLSKIHDDLSCTCPSTF